MSSMTPLWMRPQPISLQTWERCGEQKPVPLAHIYTVNLEGLTTAHTNKPHWSRHKVLNPHVFSQTVLTFLYGYNHRQATGPKNHNTRTATQPCVHKHSPPVLLYTARESDLLILLGAHWVGQLDLGKVALGGKDLRGTERAVIKAHSAATGRPDPARTVPPVEVDPMFTIRISSRVSLATCRDRRQHGESAKMQRRQTRPSKRDRHS